MRKLILFVVAILFTGITLSSCTETEPSAERQEQKTGAQNYENLAKQEPSKPTTYPANRKTINFYTTTWGEHAKTAYVYLTNASGEVVSYVVMDGPPVSMCTSLRPPYKLLDPAGDGVGPNLVVPAAGTDGVFYSGGECNTYYGKDASSGAFVEFSVGQSQSFILRDQPFTPESLQGALNLSTGKTK